MIRPLISSDYQSYSTLRSMGLGTDPASFWASDVEELSVREAKFHSTLDHPDHFILGIFVDGKLVGILGFLREDKIKLSHKGYIWGVYIHPDHRRQGFCSLIMKGAIQKAFQLEDLAQINLSVGSLNKAAIGLYKKLGFEIYGEEKNASLVNGKFHDELYLVKSSR